MTRREDACKRKCRYETEEQAQKTIEGSDVPLRTYLCIVCKGFHLSSQTEEYWRSGMKINGKLALGAQTLREGVLGE